MILPKAALTTLLVVCANLLPVSSEAQPEALPIEEAKKEGALVVYHSPGLQDMKLLVDGFRERYPSIKAEQFRASVASLYNRILNEARAKVYRPDVIILNAIYGDLLQKQGLVRKYAVPESSSILKEIRDADGYYNPLFINTHIIAYNTRLVSEAVAPKTYQDLLQPMWRGKIVLIDRLYEWYIGMQKFFGEGAADDYLSKLAHQQVTIRGERSLAAQLVAAGEHAVVVGGYGHEVEKLKQQKAPIEWVGAPPVVTNMPGVFIASHAPHPNAARLFANFVISHEGQTIVREFGRIPVRRDVKLANPKLIEGLKLVAIPPNSVEKFDAVAVKFRGFFERAQMK